MMSNFTASRAGCGTPLRSCPRLRPPAPRDPNRPRVGELGQLGCEPATCVAHTMVGKVGVTGQAMLNHGDCDLTSHPS